MDNNDLRESLTGAPDNGDDSASQGSQRSGTSLLERIRAQRAQQQQQPQPRTAPATTIQVPQYNPVARQENFAGGGPSPTTMENATNNAGGGGGGSSSNFFSEAWNNISQSMETGMASLQQEDLESADQALLAPSAYHGEGTGEEHYSMSEYFMTFVRDVYGTFLHLPLLVRITMIFALLFTAFKLM